MTQQEMAKKVREHLGKIKSSALMMSAAQSALDRNRYLRDLSIELKKAHVLLEQLEKA